jgi:hypothetical protein
MELMIWFRRSALSVRGSEVPGDRQVIVEKESFCPPHDADRVLEECLFLESQRDSATKPRVARPSQSWALGRNPFGIGRLPKSDWRPPDEK